jgi:uncharacterized membrane protein
MPPDATASTRTHNRLSQLCPRTGDISDRCALFSAPQGGPDIALRALSPAVNDPTTAVQALDRIVQFLAAVANRPLDALRYADRGGVVRLVQPVPGWEELADLGFTEIRGCAAGSPQVSRRMLAGLDDLLRHRELLTLAVERTVPNAADRDFALRPDRQGIG